MKHVLVTVTALGILGLLPAALVAADKSYQPRPSNPPPMRQQFDKVAPARPPQSSVKPDLKQPLNVHR